MCQVIFAELLKKIFIYVINLFMETSELHKTVGYLLEKIESRSTPANDIINDYLNTHRYLSAADRQEILSLTWRIIRNWFKVHYLYPDLTWGERLIRIQEETDLTAPDMPDYVKFEVPEWFIPHVPDADLELPHLLGQAPIILRANGNREKVMEMLAAEGLKVEPCTQSPYGIILAEYANLSDTKPYKKGLLEIQDEGAQLVALDIGVKPKQDVFDFCAGAGGKSLIFAQMMENRGFIQAYDAAPKRLFELVKRANRCHISIIKIVTKLPEPHKKFDHVVVDAPCTGTGTWRRIPDMRWKLNEKQLANIVKLQGEILNRADWFVKPGHYLSYITCSLTIDENEKQIQSFLKAHPNYAVLKEKRYSPYRTGTDGFYLCVMQKR